MKRNTLLLMTAAILILFSSLAHAEFKIVNIEKCGRGNETKYTVACNPLSDAPLVYVYKIDHTYKYVNHDCGASGYCKNLNEAIKNAVDCVNN